MIPLISYFHNIFNVISKMTSELILPSDKEKYAGIWFSIHTYAKSANDFESKRSFINFIKNLSENFPCEACGKHFRDYLKENPIEYYIRSDDNENLGCFRWSYIFHNAVNSRLKKKVLDWETAKSLYYNTVCNKGCNDASSRQTNSDTISTKDKPLQLPNQSKLKIKRSS
jgi:hypothetical protein